VHLLVDKEREMNKSADCWRQAQHVCR
jgi:hypothetical protein